MVGYLADCEPDVLLLLRAAADVSSHIPISKRPVHALDDMERSFDAGQWRSSRYILRLTALADRLWHDAGGAVPGALRAAAAGR